MNGAGHDRPPFVQTRFIGGGQSRLPVMHTIGGQAAVGSLAAGGMGVPSASSMMAPADTSPAMLWR
jgi:hypothetical protein